MSRLQSVARKERKGLQSRAQLAQLGRYISPYFITNVKARRPFKDVGRYIRPNSRNLHVQAQKVELEACSWQKARFCAAACFGARILWSSFLTRRFRQFRPLGQLNLQSSQCRHDPVKAIALPISSRVCRDVVPAQRTSPAQVHHPPFRVSLRVQDGSGFEGLGLST